MLLSFLSPFLILSIFPDPPEQTHHDFNFFQPVSDKVNQFATVFLFAPDYSDGVGLDLAWIWLSSHKKFIMAFSLFHSVVLLSRWAGIPTVS
jgi:hypothetical protein